jgi:hypothetical protein
MTAQRLGTQAKHVCCTHSPDTSRRSRHAQWRRARQNKCEQEANTKGAHQTCGRRPCRSRPTRTRTRHLCPRTGTPGPVCAAVRVVCVCRHRSRQRDRGQQRTSARQRSQSQSHHDRRACAMTAPAAHADPFRPRLEHDTSAQAVDTPSCAAGVQARLIERITSRRRRSEGLTCCVEPEPLPSQARPAQCSDQRQQTQEQR